MRFTIRDVLRLMVMLALSIGWLTDRRQRSRDAGANDSEAHAALVVGLKQEIEA